MSPYISVVIPNYNGAGTIARCLEAALASRYERFEVIVVDDGSDDHSVAVIRRFPCRLVRLPRHSGAAKARNAGAACARGTLLFFTDADCLLEPDTLAKAARAADTRGPAAVIGGTYTPFPSDPGFFSTFQSVFIHYSETKRTETPHYLATHALAIDAGLFRRSGGFAERFLPILEDVEFSHRLRRRGLWLTMDPQIQVRHIFGYSLFGSLRNAVRKSMYWTAYSMANGDLFEDSGTASAELKLNVAAFALMTLLAVVGMACDPRICWGVPLLIALNGVANRRLFRSFWDAKGASFALAATAYYFFIYPVAVGTGGLLGALRFPMWRRDCGAAP